MQGTVKYSEEFMTPVGLKKWIGIELPFETTAHDPLDKLSEAEKIIKAFAEKRNENPYQLTLDSYRGIPAGITPEIQVDKDLTEDDRLNAIIGDLNRCSNVESLKEYEFLAKSYVNKKDDYRLQVAYEQKLKELTQKQ